MSTWPDLDTFWQIATTTTVFVPKPDQEPACHRLLMAQMIGVFDYGHIHGYHLVRRGYEYWHTLFNREDIGDAPPMPLDAL